MACVIGLQSTGEASTTLARDQNGDAAMDDFVSAPQMILLRLINLNLFSFKVRLRTCARACIERVVGTVIRVTPMLEHRHDTTGFATCSALNIGTTSLVQLP